MKNVIIVVIILVVVGLGIFYFVSNNRSVDINIPAVSASEVNVNIKNFSFSPATLNVKSGTKVIWTNNDNVPHTVTSDSDNVLNSPSISPGQSFSFVFTNIGTEKYHCNFHTMMKAQIVVEK